MTLQVTIHRFNGQNFLKWFQSMKLFVRGKIGYLIGATKALRRDYPTYSI